MTDADADAALVAKRLRKQAAACERLGSELYAGLLARSADDVEAGGPVAALLAGRGTDPPDSALALRFLGAVHRLVLAGGAPELARWYPSAGGWEGATAEQAWPAFLATVEARGAQLRERLDDGVQTNEPGRAAALLGGFLTVASRAGGLPLRLLELGSSGGLNLRFDRFRYEAGAFRWGDPASPLVLRPTWEGGSPPLDAPLEVAERAGCDPAPVDLSTEEGRRRLRSFVWPDQVTRRARLDAALEVAAAVPVAVDRAPAGTWVPARLAERRGGVATVVVHSIVWQYVAPDEQRVVTEAIEAAGGRARADAPLAWLRLEPLDGRWAELRLRTWPGGADERLGLAGYHGDPVRWGPVEPGER